ncbi:MAG: hypothetical protein K0R77_2274 [Chryseobacterium sp.]|nr:hypothetical protein [Chryseobacterium sp.]
MHKGGSAFQFFKTDLPVDIVSVSLTLLIPFLAHTILIFGAINLFEHNKTLEKIQSFIKISETD